MKRKIAGTLFLCLGLALACAVTARAALPGWGNVQFPTATTTETGVQTEWIYGQVWLDGVTTPPGQGAGITAELGYGPAGTSPAGNPAWTWVSADYNVDVVNNDEYRARLTPALPGTYDYAYRYNYNGGGDWLYTDTGGSSSIDPYNPEEAGKLDVEGQAVTPEGTCSKWYQVPDCQFGIDLPSYARVLEQGAASNAVTMMMVADDWVCDGRPIDGIRWWGSYPGWPDLVPPMDDQSGRPLGFRLTWYTDIPADHPDNATGHSMPGAVLKTVYAPLLAFGVTNAAAGQVIEEYYCTVHGKADPPGLEHEYLYSLELPEPWNEKEGRIYWLGIEAVFAFGYDPKEPAHVEWGWKTTWEMDVIDDACVWLASDPRWQELTWPVFPYPNLVLPSGNYGPFLDPASEESVNLAFELLTTVCPRRTTKWSQPPDMENGTDIWSWRDLESAHKSMVLLADDFVSDGRRITDVHWWGSYSNWMTWADGSETNPVPPPSTFPWRPYGFNLSWHEYVEPCEVGREITNVTVLIDQCHEMYYGTVTQRWVNPEPPYYYEHEYQYYVDLLEAAAPWLEEEGVHYWLNIEALFDPSFTPSGQENQHGGWGWKITPVITECPAMASNRVSGLWGQAALPPGYIPEKVGQPFDLAFELTTDEVSTNAPTLPIRITELEPENLTTGHLVYSTGTCGAGTQYLQANTNLLTTNWVTVSTKAAPYPPPLTNMWVRPGLVADSNVFYRILEK